MEMFKLVSRKIDISKINDLLDIGTTNDSKLSSSNFSKKEINNLKFDLVISSAAIEHVGNFNNQTIKVRNMIKLSKNV